MVTDPKGEPLGPFITKADKWVGDITADVWNSVFGDVMKSGSGPAYMDCTKTDADDIAYMMWGLKEEGNTALVDMMARENVDPKRHRIEFMQYQPFLIGRGPEIDIDGQTGIAGLYAVGDAVGNFRADIAGAATYGHIAGEHAARQARTIDGFEPAERAAAVAECHERYSRFLEGDGGATWKEANHMLQQIMKDYAGNEVRSETLLTAGLKYLHDLKRHAIDRVACRDAHELMRMTETMELMDCAEAIVVSALARQETRGSHRRSDFQFTNPLLAGKFLTVSRKDGRPQLRFRDRILDMRGHDGYFPRRDHAPSAAVSAAAG